MLAAVLAVWAGLFVFLAARFFPLTFFAGDDFRLSLTPRALELGDVRDVREETFFIGDFLFFAL